MAIYSEKMIVNQMRKNLPYCQLETQKKLRTNSFMPNMNCKNCKTSHINFHDIYGCVEKVY